MPVGATAPYASINDYATDEKGSVEIRKTENLTSISAHHAVLYAVASAVCAGLVFMLFTFCNTEFSNAGKEVNRKLSVEKKQIEVAPNSFLALKMWEDDMDESEDMVRRLIYDTPHTLFVEHIDKYQARNYHYFLGYQLYPQLVSASESQEKLDGNKAVLSALQEKKKVLTEKIFLKIMEEDIVGNAAAGIRRALHLIHNTPHELFVGYVDVIVCPADDYFLCFQLFPELKKELNCLTRIKSEQRVSSNKALLEKRTSALKKKMDVLIQKLTSK